MLYIVPIYNPPCVHIVPNYLTTYQDNNILISITCTGTSDLTHARYIHTPKTLNINYCRMVLTRNIFIEGAIHRECLNIISAMYFNYDYL